MEIEIRNESQKRNRGAQNPQVATDPKKKEPHESRCTNIELLDALTPNLWIRIELEKKKEN